MNNKNIAFLITGLLIIAFSCFYSVGVESFQTIQTQTYKMTLRRKNLFE